MLENYYEKKSWKKDELILGIDEAGRGPLAGPLVVAGVVFPKNYQNDFINDSKKLTKSKRIDLFQAIINDALFYQIEVISVAEIDEINILKATTNANYKIAKLANTNYVLTDAIKLELEKQEVISLIKGDQKSISIAGASILAKVIRDNLMEYYDFLYPAYGLKQHKGYPTKKHIAAIKKLGLSPIHRKSFKIKSLQQITLDL